MNNVAETLEAAASYIDKHGWCQFDLEKHGRVCALGAIVRLGPDTVYGIEALRLLADYVYPKWIDPGVTVSCWNDSPGRSVEEVTATMRAVALLWRSKNQELEVNPPEMRLENECC